MNEPQIKLRPPQFLTALGMTTLMFCTISLGVLAADGADANKAGAAGYKKLAGDLVQSFDSKGKARIGVLGFGTAGGGKSPEKLNTAAQLARAELEQALSQNSAVDVIARDRLADLENENDFQNKKSEIKGVDAIVRGNLFYKGTTVAVHAELVFLDGKKKMTSVEIPPEFLGLPRLAQEETEMPPALASVRISDQTMFDIHGLSVKLRGIQTLLQVPAKNANSEDAAAIALVLKKSLQTRKAEQRVAAEKVIAEMEKLSSLDSTMVEQAFNERRSELLLKAAEAGLDTSLQRQLLGKAQDLQKQSKQDGVKLTIETIISIAN